MMKHTRTTNRISSISAIFALLCVLFLTAGCRSPEEIELQLLDASVNRFGNTTLVFANTGCDCRNIRMTFESSGPNQSLTARETLSCVREIDFWQKNTTRELWFLKKNFVEYATECKVTIQCSEGSREYHYSWK